MLSSRAAATSEVYCIYKASLVGQLCVRSCALGAFAVYPVFFAASESYTTPTATTFD